MLESRGAAASEGNLQRSPGGVRLYAKAHLERNDEICNLLSDPHEFPLDKIDRAALNLGRDPTTDDNRNTL